MKTQDIVIGGIYRNRGQGRTRREVLDIGPDIGFIFYSPHQDRKPRIGVRWRYANTLGLDDTMSLESFAAWAGARVAREVPE